MDISLNYILFRDTQEFHDITLLVTIIQRIALRLKFKEKECF